MSFRFQKKFGNNIIEKYLLIQVCKRKHCFNVSIWITHYFKIEEEEVDFRNKSLLHLEMAKKSVNRF